MEQNKDQISPAVRGEAVAEFNINDTMIVTLTEFGAKIWNDRWNDIPIPGHLIPNPVSAGYVLKDQMWDLMNTFGPHIYLGGDMPFLNAMMAHEKVSARAADAPSEPSETTDLSHRLRETADKQPGWKPLLNAAADEIERYYGGMLAWKKTAEKKDRDWNNERMERVNDRIKSRAADALDSQPTGLPVLYATHVENIELALAQELDDAALSANDYVTVNREKLRGIAERILAAAKLELSSQPTEPWTRTEDRLPPVETPVLILHSGDVKIGEIRWENPSHEETFEAFMYWDDPNDDGQSWDWLEVTHWMPIPPAPASSQPTDGGVRNGCV